MKKVLFIIIIAAMTSCGTKTSVSDERMSNEYESALDAMNHYKQIHGSEAFYNTKCVEVKAMTKSSGTYTERKTVKCGLGSVSSIYLLKNEYCKTHKIDDYALCMCGYEAHKAFFEEKWTDGNHMYYYIDEFAYYELPAEKRSMYIELYQPYEK